MQFLPSSGYVSSTIGMHQIDAELAVIEIARREQQENAASYIEQILEAISYKTAAIRPLTSHL